VRIHADFKCHTEWGIRVGKLGDKPTKLVLFHKAYCYLVVAYCRKNLDDLCDIHDAGIIPMIFPDVAIANLYREYLVYTRFAHPGHPAYVKGRAESFVLFGQYGSPESSLYNMNLEATIKSQLVDANLRRAFPSVYPMVAFLSGHTLDNRPLPKSLPRNIRLLKSRCAREREPRFHLANKIEYAVALATIVWLLHARGGVIKHGVKATDNKTVVLVARDVAFMRALTDDPKLLKNAISTDVTTRHCIELYDGAINGFFEQVRSSDSTRLMPVIESTRLILWPCVFPMV
jgi:hypothetical protein